MKGDDATSKHNEKATMSLTKWTVAFDAYAVAAASISQWEYPVPYAHKNMSDHITNNQLFHKF